MWLIFQLCIDAMPVINCVITGEVCLESLPLLGYLFIYPFPISADILRECIWPVIQLWIFMTTGMQMFCI